MLTYNSYKYRFIFYFYFIYLFIFFLIDMDSLFNLMLVNIHIFKTEMKYHFFN